MRIFSRRSKNLLAAFVLTAKLMTIPFISACVDEEPKAKAKWEQVKSSERVYELAETPQNTESLIVSLENMIVMLNSELKTNRNLSEKEKQKIEQKINEIKSKIAMAKAEQIVARSKQFKSLAIPDEASMAIHEASLNIANEKYDWRNPLVAIVNGKAVEILNINELKAIKYETFVPGNIEKSQANAEAMMRMQVAKKNLF